MLKHHKINLSPKNIIGKNIDFKQKINLEPASAASGNNSRYTYGEIFANKIKLFWGEIFKKY